MKTNKDTIAAVLSAGLDTNRHHTARRKTVFTSMSMHRQAKALVER